MRRFVALLLAALPALAEPDEADPARIVLHEPRAWRGTIEAVAVSREGPEVEGIERQEERVEFVLVTEPPRTSLVAPQLEWRPREASGTWRVRVDRTEGRGADAEVLKGGGEGRLHPRLAGAILPTVGRYRLEVGIEPRVLVGLRTLTGLDRGRPAVYRSSLEREPLLAGFAVEGELEEGGRFARGERTRVDRDGRYPRDVTVRWTIERIDPVVAGRVTGPDGEPLAGVTVVARTTNANRVRDRLPPLRFDTTTGPDGRFEIPAWQGLWHCEVRGFLRDGLLYEGVGPTAVQVRFDSVPRVDAALTAYLLARLPQPHLLHRNFDDDVARYLHYLRERHPEARLAAAIP